MEHRELQAPRFTVIRIIYHFAKVVLSLSLVLPYFQWKTRKAKRAFKHELLRNGIPEELADNLADAYNSGNKNILRSVTSLH